MKKICGFINFILLTIMLVLINIGSMSADLNIITYDNYAFMLRIIGFINIGVYIFNKISFRERIKFKDIIIVLLIIIGYISYLNAEIKEYALYGFISRNEGLYSLISYYSIFLLGTMVNDKDKKYIFFIVLLFGVMQVFIGFLEINKVYYIFGINRTGSFCNNFNSACGTFGNPNFYSTYILLCLVYSLTRLVNSHGKYFILYLILTSLFLLGLFIGNTLSCILSFIIIFIYIFVKKINKNNIINVLKIFLIIFISLFLSIKFFDHYNRNRVSKVINKNIREVNEILKNGIDDSTGNNRIYVWKESLKFLPKYYLTGIGIDNFYYINESAAICKFDEKEYECFDKAHNEYIQILMTEGIFAFIIYLGLIYYVFKNGQGEFKLVFLSYLIQAFFNISVITVAPVFYMIMGFLISNKNINKIDC